MSKPDFSPLLTTIVDLELVVHLAFQGPTASWSGKEEGEGNKSARGNTGQEGATVLPCLSVDVGVESANMTVYTG